MKTIDKRQKADNANEGRAGEIMFLALTIADTTASEEERALAAMITATAQEILKLHGWHGMDEL